MTAYSRNFLIPTESLQVSWWQ